MVSGLRELLLLFWFGIPSERDLDQKDLVRGENGDGNEMFEVWFYGRC